MRCIFPVNQLLNGSGHLKPTEGLVFSSIRNKNVKNAHALRQGRRKDISKEGGV